MPKLTALIAVMALAVSLGGCHVVRNVHIAFENRTSEELLVEVNDQGTEKVKAATSRTISYLAEGVARFEITVTTADGEIIFHETLTESELEEIGNRIIIEEPSSSIPIPHFIHPAASRFALPYPFREVQNSKGRSATKEALRHG